MAEADEPTANRTDKGLWLAPTRQASFKSGPLYSLFQYDAGQGELLAAAYRGFFKSSSDRARTQNFFAPFGRRSKSPAPNFRVTLGGQLIGSRDVAIYLPRVNRR